MLRYVTFCYSFHGKSGPCHMNSMQESKHNIFECKNVFKVLLIYACIFFEIKKHLSYIQS